VGRSSILPGIQVSPYSITRDLYLIYLYTPTLPDEPMHPRSVFTFTDISHQGPCNAEEIASTTHIQTHSHSLTGISPISNLSLTERSMRAHVRLNFDHGWAFRVRKKIGQGYVLLLFKWFPLFLCWNMWKMKHFIYFHFIFYLFKKIY
jgi:hypothetical protein